MNRQIRVLMVVMNLKVANGVSSYAMNYFRHLDSSRIHMDFVMYHDKEPFYRTEVEGRGSKVFVLPSLRKLSRHIKVCKRILREGKYDIVHNNCLLITLPLMACAKQLSVPVRILHSHSSIMGETRLKAMRNSWFVPFLKMQANTAMACSEAAGKQLFGKRVFNVLPNAIEISVYRFDKHMREKVRTEFCVGERYVVGSVGRITEAKNPFFAIDVFKELHSRHPETLYWWVGSGPLEAQVKEYVDQQGLQDSVIFLGNRSDVAQLYQGMDVFLMPSLNEGFGISAVEAQMAGCQCVLSDRVPKDVECSNLVHFCTLKASISQWATLLWEALEKSRIESPVCDWSKYEITHCARNLEDAYEDLFLMLDKEQ